MHSIASSGTLFPYFWANTIQSHRGYSSILCGVSGNTERAISFTPERLEHPCLPALLAESGYATVYLEGFNKPLFENKGPFLESIGMQEVHIGTIMEGAQEYRWGYDDCDFYEKAFAYLEQEHPEKESVFAMFKVAMHHLQYVYYPEHYLPLAPFNNPANFLEQYLNSIAAQDHCLAAFSDLFRQYAPENTHLFILADHSWPIGMHSSTYNEFGASSEHFLIPLVYVPPRSRLDEFAQGKEVPAFSFSQTDITPTIFGLLNDSAPQNSFAHVLRNIEGEGNHEACQLLVQPYDGIHLAVVRDGFKYTYHAESNTVSTVDLLSDPAELDPRVLATDVAMDAFIKRYYCDRFEMPSQP